MLAAAALPLVALVGSLVLITGGMWPSGLGPTVAIVAMAGALTLAVMNRLLAGPSRTAPVIARPRC